MNIGYGILRILFPKSSTCYGSDHDAKLLCKNKDAIEQFHVPTWTTLRDQVHSGSYAYNLIDKALTTYKNVASQEIFSPTLVRDEIVALKQYYQNRTVYTQPGVVFVPYRYLVPFNIVFNWSLQNLSSYYTDIGFVWLILLLLLVLGWIYTWVSFARYQQKQHLFTLSSLALLWWAIRWIIWWGILWYGMWLIIWTIITIARILQERYTTTKKQDMTLLYVIFFILALWALVQYTFNFIRISSQGWGGPFLWYRMNYGKSIEVTDTLQQKQVVKPYTRKDVFDLQFPYYNKFIDYVRNRSNTDGVMIAWTYLQYFLHNQRNIMIDGMLNRFREQGSDGNMCKMYHRLRSQHIKYLVIDPNIATVVMGEGNESLFHRFFGKVDGASGKIQEYGAITYLVRLWKSGYLTLFSTNNLWAKYAFVLPDETLKKAFGITSDDDILLTKAKLSVARFFPDAQKYIQFIADTFVQRIQTQDALGDIADVFGKPIREDVLKSLASNILKTRDINAISTQVQQLSQDERRVLLQYLSLFQMLTTQAQGYQEMINSILGQSIAWGAQLMIFELQ